MNIKIKKELHKKLLSKCTNKKCVIGSHLYGTATDKSDKDILCFYENNLNGRLNNLPNIHQMQYTEDNVDYIWTNINQFWKNQMSGDSTINSDVILFTDDIVSKDKLKYCKTYKVIRGYIGFANRDLKNVNGKNKLFHAQRSLYTAKCLIENKLPKISEIQKIKLSLNKLEKTGQIAKHLRNECKELRAICNSMYEKGELQNYYIPNLEYNYMKDVILANNIKEFRYV